MQADILVMCITGSIGTGYRAARTVVYDHRRAGGWEPLEGGRGQIWSPDWNRTLKGTRFDKKKFWGISLTFDKLETSLNIFFYGSRSVSDERPSSTISRSKTKYETDWLTSSQSKRSGSYVDP
jgi:hypothetical protein